VLGQEVVDFLNLAIQETMLLSSSSFRRGEAFSSRLLSLVRSSTNCRCRSCRLRSSSRPVPFARPGQVLDPQPDRIQPRGHQPLGLMLVVRGQDFARRPSGRPRYHLDHPLTEVLRAETPSPPQRFEHPFVRRAAVLLVGRPFLQRLPVTDSVLEEVQEWQNRGLERMYPVVFCDALRVKIRDEGTVRNKAVYLALGMTPEGLKVMKELRHRGVEDILIAVVDGLKGFPEAITTTFPETSVLKCIVHLLRHSLAFCGWKDRQKVAAEFKKVCRAQGRERRDLRCPPP